MGVRRAAVRALVVCGIALGVGLGLAGCGSGSRGPRSAGATSGATSPLASRLAGTVTLLMAQGPASLDPAGTISPAGMVLEWPVYTGLVAFRHAPGRAGRQLVPGLATAMPRITDGGRTYRITLRRGLRFSDGETAHATDFLATVERAIGNPDNGVRRLLIPLVVGARRFASGRGKSIPGIVVDDATRTIVIHLRRPYPAFDDVLAAPALGLVSADAPLREQPYDPPAGIGPLKITRIRPGSLQLVRNPDWRAQPGIPTAHLDVDVRFTGNASVDARAVLNNVGDVLDPADPVPTALLGQLRRQARARFSTLGAGPVDFIFLNPRTWPFRRLAARRAVVAALSQNALLLAADDSVTGRCELLPPVLSLHGVPCPGRSTTGDLSGARALVRASGTLGTPVTVVSGPGIHARRWAATEAATLRQIGYPARLSVIHGTTAAYRRVTATAQTGIAQAGVEIGAPWAPLGFADPGPRPAVSGLSGAALAAVGRTAATDPAAVGTAWTALGHAIAQRAGLFVIGDQRLWRFTSARVDHRAMHLSPVYGLDLLSLRLR